jgi:hypothetical protein
MKLEELISKVAKEYCFGSQDWWIENVKNIPKIATIKRFESGKFWLNMKQYILLRNALQLPTSF